LQQRPLAVVPFGVSSSGRRGHAEIVSGQRGLCNAPAVTARSPVPCRADGPLCYTHPVTDAEAMDEALRLAREAAQAGEVPVGAVALHDGVIVGRGRNAREAARDPTAHAELLAIQEAARTLGRWRLTGVTLVVTLEPCAMCAGAMVLARIDRLIYAASDPKAGAAGSLQDLCNDPRLNHRLPVERGLRGEEAGELLRDFFRSRRGANPG